MTLSLPLFLIMLVIVGIIVILLINQIANPVHRKYATVASLLIALVLVLWQFGVI